MKYLAILVIIALSSEIGYSLPSISSSLESSGLLCKIDDDGHVAECDEENSQLPDDLNTNGAVPTSAFECIDVTYRTGLILKKTHHVMQCAYQLKGQRLCAVLSDANDVSKCIESSPEPKPDPTSPAPAPPSGSYCIVDDVDNTVECTLGNSVLPSDLSAGKYKKDNEYICLDITYKTGLFPLQQSHHVRQCALKLSDEDLCNVLKDNNDVPSCSQSPPYNTPTVEPPSGLYCEVDSSGDKVECSKANSLLPSDLHIFFAEESSNYVCLSTTYKVGIFPLEKTRTTEQCAHELNGDQDLCTVLRNFNNIQKCVNWIPSSEQNE